MRELRASRAAVTASLIAGSLLGAAPAALGQLTPPAPTPQTVPERAGGSLSKINSVSELTSKWRPDCPLYLHGNGALAEREMAELGEWLSEHNRVSGSHWTVVLVERSANYEYARGSHGDSRGVNGYLAEIKDRFLHDPRFEALASPQSGKPNGALLFVSLDRDGQNRKMILWTKAEYEENGVGSGSNQFLKDIFPHAASLIRDQGSVSEGIKYVVGSMDAALIAEKSAAFHLTSGQKQALIIGGVVVGVAVLAGVAIAASSRRNRYGYGSSGGGSGGSSFVFFDSGGWGGGSDGGGFGGGDGGGCCSGGDGGGGGSY